VDQIITYVILLSVGVVLGAGISVFFDTRRTGGRCANTSTNNASTPCCKTDMVGVVAYYKCSTCGRIVEPERD